MTPSSPSFSSRRNALAVMLVAMLAAGWMLYPAFAMACPGGGICTPMGFVLCQIVGFVYGNMGRGLAILAIIIVGVGATLGKVSWGLAVTVAIGISTIFGAPSILGALGIPAACV